MRLSQGRHSNVTACEAVVGGVVNDTDLLRMSNSKAGER
jgi:hypothetical protein